MARVLAPHADPCVCCLGRFNKWPGHSLPDGPSNMQCVLEQSGALGEGQGKPLARRCFLRVMTWRSPAGPVLLEVLVERRTPVVQLRRVFTFFSRTFYCMENCNAATILRPSRQRGSVTRVMVPSLELAVRILEHFLTLDQGSCSILIVC